MKALVTGATGFIGGHIVDRLTSDGWQVRCLVRNHSKAAKLINLGADIIIGDLQDLDALRCGSKDVDCVFHAAAKVNDWGSWEEFEKDTVIGTRNILTVAMVNKVSRFVHISSVDVYDRALFKSGIPRVKEDAPFVPENEKYFYARAKMLAEKEVASFCADGKIESVIIRPGTVYGPYDQTILPRVIDYLHDPLACWVSDFNPVLGLIHIYDLVDLCMKAASCEGISGQAYNAVSDEDIRLREFIETICKFLELNPPKHSIPYWLAVIIVGLSERIARLINRTPMFTHGALEFFTCEQRFDIMKAKQDLDWKPEVLFADGIKSALNFEGGGMSG